MLQQYIIQIYNFLEQFGVASIVCNMAAYTNLEVYKIIVMVSRLDFNLNAALSTV